jgi:hypothetical protein
MVSNLGFFRAKGIGQQIPFARLLYTLLVLLDLFLKNL